MTLVVRAPRPSDARAVAVLRNDVWRASYGGLVAPELLEALDDARGTEVWEGRISLLNGRGVDHNGAMVRVAVDVDSEQIIGMGEVVQVNDAAAPAPLELRMFNVHPAHARQGVGARMLRALIASRDCTAWVVRGNDHAVAFLRSQGFTPTGEERSETKFGVPEIEMLRQGWQAPGF